MVPVSRFANFMDISPLEKHFDNLIRDSLALQPFFKGEATLMTNPMTIDVKDLGDSYEVKANIPGVSKDEISCVLNDDGIMEISYSHSEKNEEDENHRYLYNERKTSGSRRFVLDGANKETAKASYADGVLTVTVDKNDEDAKNENNKIEIK